MTITRDRIERGAAGLCEDVQRRPIGSLGLAADLGQTRGSLHDSGSLVNTQR
jgi:hypothetical protein